MRRPVEAQIRQLDWPEPPAELRARILADAHVGAVRIAWSDRLWFSREFRWSVAALATAMIVINVAGGLQPAGPPNVAGGLQPAESAATTQAIEDSVAAIGLPADFARALAKRTVVARAAETRQALEIDGGGGQ